MPFVQDSHDQAQAIARKKQVGCEAFLAEELARFNAERRPFYATLVGLGFITWLLCGASMLRPWLSAWTTPLLFLIGFNPTLAALFYPTSRAQVAREAQELGDPTKPPRDVLYG